MMLLEVLIWTFPLMAMDPGLSQPDLFLLPAFFVIPPY
jgi:hypothetical protein